jgi:NAD(P)-dependent dehydrogenase (short-subunit alcohol dehydrogenase family)
MKPRHTEITPKARPTPAPQHQELPGEETKMLPKPMDDDPRYRGSEKLLNKVALISGGDSGIGRATAIAFAKEGADVAFIYLSEETDADRTVKAVTDLGRRSVKIRGDVGDEQFCKRAVQQVLREFDRLDILVNNAAEQHVGDGLESITAEQLEKTFRTNLFGYFYLAKAALPHLKSGAAIINTTSIQAYKPNPSLMDYASTKGAILNFTRSLAQELSSKCIRVNAVAPGPVWTPLIPASFPPEEVAEFGKDTPMGRPAQPCEIAPSFVFFASEVDSGYVTGQVLHVNGGELMAS